MGRVAAVFQPQLLPLQAEDVVVFLLGVLLGAGLLGLDAHALRDGRLQRFLGLLDLSGLGLVLLPRLVDPGLQGVCLLQIALRQGQLLGLVPLHRL